MGLIINKTMDRDDLLAARAGETVQALNDVIRALYARGLHMTSWYGGLPLTPGQAVKRIIKRLLGRQEEKTSVVGRRNRGPGYEPLAGAADDDVIPWYLYWEAYWVTENGPRLTGTMRLLDAGGTSSLFSCYLASRGHEVHSVDLNGALVSNARAIARAMDWKMISYAMNMKKLDFEDEYFDHAYSICVFEHLDYDVKQAALSEIARCLKPGGVLSITFDFRNPAPNVAGVGPDIRERNRLTTHEDITRAFLSCPRFTLMGNQAFLDNGKSYLVHPGFDDAPYTFGAIFLKKKS
jgi:SAM-dependent methyltransferase